MFDLHVFSFLGKEDQGHLPHYEHVQSGCDSEVSHCGVLVSCE